MGQIFVNDLLRIVKQLFADDEVLCWNTVIGNDCVSFSA